MLAIAEPLLGRTAFADLQLDDPVEPAERCLLVETEQMAELCRRTRQINGISSLGPVEVLEALARLVGPPNQRLAANLRQRAADVELTVHGTSTEELDTALARLISDATRPQPAWLGGGDKVTNPIAWLDDPILWIDHANRTAIIDLVADSNSVPSILAKLWARAVDPVSGRTLGFARFDAPALDNHTDQSPTTPIWTNGHEHLRATIPLPASIDSNSIACDFQSLWDSGSPRDIRLTEGHL